MLPIGLAREGVLDSMENLWLPSWLGLTWTAVFAIVLTVHLWHVVVMTGQHRLWHGVHVLMAVGMIVMFAPTDRMIVSGGFGAVVFGTAAAGLAGALLGERVARGAGVGRLWLVSLVDLAAMSYMFAMMSIRLVWLTLPLVAWFALQATGWASGRLCTVLADRGLDGPSLVSAPALTAVGATATSTPPGVVGTRFQLLPDPGEAHHGAVHSSAIRVTLSLMAVGMAYMLIAMQFGMRGM